MRVLGWITLRFLVIGGILASEITPHLALAESAPSGIPLTEPECETFGRQLERHFAAGDKGYYVRSFDADRVLDKLIASHPAAAAELEPQRAEFKKQFNDFLFAKMNQTGSLKFLRVKRVRGEPRVLCRVLASEKGLDYLEITLERGSRGGPRVADAFDLLTGETVSESFSRAFFVPLAVQDKTLQQELFHGQSDLTKFYPEWSQLAKLNAQGKHQQVLSLFNKLPASLQTEKFILLEKVHAASDTNEEAYLEALELWARSYPNDAGTEILAIDGFMFRKKYGKALECVERLDKLVGGDAHLDYLRAEFYERLGDTEKSRQAANRVINREPELLEPYFFLLASLSRKHQFPSGVSVLNRLWSASNLPKAMVIQIVEAGKDYAPLVKSDEYRKWRGAPVAGTVRTVAATDKSGTAQANLKLQSIFYQPTRPGATLNGQFVMVGDKLKGHKVLAIDQKSVTVENPDGKKQVLTLAD
jgi:tetratricopeptide (TPR) repeat protein